MPAKLASGGGGGAQPERQPTRPLGVWVSSPMQADLYEVNKAISFINHSIGYRVLALVDDYSDAHVHIYRMPFWHATSGYLGGTKLHPGGVDFETYTEAGKKGSAWVALANPQFLTPAERPEQIPGRRVSPPAEGPPTLHQETPAHVAAHELLHTLDIPDVGWAPKTPTFMNYSERGYLPYLQSNEVKTVWDYYLSLVKNPGAAEAYRA